MIIKKINLYPNLILIALKNTDFISVSRTHALNISTLIVLLAALFNSGNTFAAGQLMVTPTRIVFEGNERTKQVNLMNNGTEAGRFRVSFVRRKMTEDGKFENISEEVDGMYSDEFIRYSPRQVTLEPGQAQTVRLMLRKKRDMPEGEYRSHMLFQTLPDPVATDVSNLAGNDDKLSVSLIPVVGITIPVIAREGEVTSTVSLSDFKIQQENTVRAGSELSLKLNRQGNASSYGDLRVSFRPHNGKAVVIGQINGIAVYTPLESRTVSIKLQMPTGISLSDGELHITYLTPGKDKQSGLIAESRLAVP